MSYKHCDQCGHHHGTDKGWPSCGAYHDHPEQGFRRCGCIHQNNRQETA